MQNRYHIQNVTHFAEFEFSTSGKEKALAFRANNPEFKRRRIRSVIQAYPSRVPLGKKTAFTIAP